MALADTGLTGTLTIITTDTVPLPISGGQWATAKFTVKTAGTATATAQVSIDGGINYNPAPYAKRLSTVSANPTVQAITATTLVTGDVWEVPLPANATHFQLLCGGTGSVTTVTLSGGALYVPGMPVTATLYDVTTAFTVGQTTGVFDTSGWSQGSVIVINGDTGGTSRALSVFQVLSSGANGGGAGGSIASGASGSHNMGGPASTGSSYFIDNTAFMPKRTNIILGAGTGAGGSAEMVFEVRR